MLAVGGDALIAPPLSRRHHPPQLCLVLQKLLPQFIQPALKAADAPEIMHQLQRQLLAVDIPGKVQDIGLYRDMGQIIVRGSAAYIGKASILLAPEEHPCGINPLFREDAAGLHTEIRRGHAVEVASALAADNHTAQYRIFHALPSLPAYHSHFQPISQRKLDKSGGLFYNVANGIGVFGAGCNSPPAVKVRERCLR